MRGWVVVCSLVVALGLLAAGVLVLGDGGDKARPSSGSRALTRAEADRLGVTRFRNYTAGVRKVALAIPQRGRSLQLTGVVDFRHHLGYGVLAGADAEGPVLVQWTPRSVIVRPWVADRPRPLTPPRDGWTGRGLTDTGSSLDTALLLTLSLAGDRPENAQLLNQNGARHLRTEQAAGERVDVIAGPTPAGGSRTRFWLTDNGTMIRFEADIDTEPAPVVVTLGRTLGAEVPAVPGLVGGRASA